MGEVEAKKDAVRLLDIANKVGKDLLNNSATVSSGVDIVEKKYEDVIDSTADGLTSTIDSASSALKAVENAGRNSFVELMKMADDSGQAFNVLQALTKTDITDAKLKEQVSLLDPKKVYGENTSATSEDLKTQLISESLKTLRINSSQLTEVQRVYIASLVNTEHKKGEPTSQLEAANKFGKNNSYLKLNEQSFDVDEKADKFITDLRKQLGTSTDILGVSIKDLFGGVDVMDKRENAPNKKVIIDAVIKLQTVIARTLNLKVDKFAVDGDFGGVTMSKLKEVLESTKYKSELTAELRDYYIARDTMQAIANDRVSNPEIAAEVVEVASTDAPTDDAVHVSSINENKSAVKVATAPEKVPVSEPVQLVGAIPITQDNEYKPQVTDQNDESNVLDFNGNPITKEIAEKQRDYLILYFNSTYKSADEAVDFEEKAMDNGFRDRAEADKYLSVLTGTTYSENLKDGDSITTPDNKKTTWFKTLESEAAYYRSHTDIFHPNNPDVISALSFIDATLLAKKYNIKLDIGSYESSPALYYAINKGNLFNLSDGGSCTEDNGTTFEKRGANIYYRVQPTLINHQWRSLDGGNAEFIKEADGSMKKIDDATVTDKQSGVKVPDFDDTLQPDALAQTQKVVIDDL